MSDCFLIEVLKEDHPEFEGYDIFTLRTLCEALIQCLYGDTVSGEHASQIEPLRYVQFFVFIIEPSLVTLWSEH